MRKLLTKKEKKKISDVRKIDRISIVTEMDELDADVYVANLKEIFNKNKRYPIGNLFILAAKRLMEIYDKEN